MGRCQSSP
jgi:hypothetical protein